MKFIPGILLWTAAACAADFTTGQAARAVIGQQTFTAADPNSSNTVIGGASGIAYAADTLFVADDNRMGAAPENNRVLLFQNLATMLPAPMAALAYTTQCPVCVGQASIVLGQPDFSTTTTPLTTTQNNLRQPTAVASDGVHLVVADTNHNRVLIWNHIPTTNNTPADVVVGQPNFTTSTVPTNYTPTAKTMSGPQGIWIQNGKLFVADTENNRVLIYNNVPTTNGVAADVVLGQPSFTTPVQVDITQQGNCTNDTTSTCTATASNMLNPVSVTSDGTHVFVSDLGYNRILIWNSIPTKNAAPADVEIGQPNMNTGAPNFAYSVSSPTSLASAATTTVETAVLCTVSNGTDSNGNPTYPNACNYTLNFPRFALSDGTRLFVADGGNDRILEYLTIPTQNAAGADTILGQIGGDVDQATDAADSVNTPTALAFDGTNLYVADPYNRRITVYTVAPNILPYQAVVNTANPNIYASGSVTIGGVINNGDIVTITIGSIQYAYTIKATDTITNVIAALVAEINTGSGDPNVIAIEDDADSQVKLQARVPGPQGDNTTYSVTVSTNAQITATAADSHLDGGGNAAAVAPGTIVSINGTGLSNQTVSADLTQPTLPTTLGGVQVYFNGVAAPLTYVSPTQINAQIPWEFTSTTSINAYVVSQMNGGVTFTSPVAVTVVGANPGVYGMLTSNPEIGIAMHYSSFATAIVSVDGSINGGDVATVTVRGRSYNYTVQSTDTLDTVRDALVSQLQQDPEVTATAAGVFDRIIITALIAGPEGEGIPITGTASSGASITITAFDSQTCCSNIADALVTQANPAKAGELITVITTGMGLPVLTSGNQQYIVTGAQYPIGAPITAPQQFANALAGGSTADVIQATLMPGTVGLFEVVLHLSPGLTANANTSLTVAQGAFVSNPVAIPVVSTSSSTPGAATTPASTPVAPTPQSTANVTAVINGASFQTGFASATWVSIFGTNLSQATQTWQDSDFAGNSLPTSLSGVSVTINSLAAYVQYVSPTQINVLAPDDTTVGPVLVQVKTAEGISNTFTAQKNQLAPAFFSMSGTSYVAALHADYTSVGKTGLIAGVNSSPAIPGETILIYGTGFGPTNPALPSAQLVNTPATLASSVQVTIGGVPAPVAYAGLVEAGLYQINVTVPNVADGDAVVVGQIGGVQTQPGVSITIQHPGN
jgi:uncharacterized protein (TIGR03437 family)